MTDRPQNPRLGDYPAHLRPLLSEVPKAPGVYLFYGANNELPLYIGKSVDLRSRLLSHLRNPDEAKMLYQTQRIEHIRCIGEIGALLLESELIKKMRPLYNKRLRKIQGLFSIALLDAGIEIVPLKAKPDSDLYGLYRSPFAAKEALRELADEFQLCLMTLGLEPYSKRGCFRSQMGRCRGVCCAKETHAVHQARLSEALATRKIRQWPYAGRIAIREREGRKQALHVIDHWHYQGTYKSLVSAKNAPKQPVAEFDLDSYKILVRPLFSGALEVLEL